MIIYTLCVDNIIRKLWAEGIFKPNDWSWVVLVFITIKSLQPNIYYDILLLYCSEMS